MALLCHWMIRHTFEPEWIEHEKPDAYGRYREKVWVERIALPRWIYVLIWLFCTLLAPLSIIAPIAVGVFLGRLCSDEYCKFIYTNRLIEWLKKEV